MLVENWDSTGRLALLHNRAEVYVFNAFFFWRSNSHQI